MRVAGWVTVVAGMLLFSAGAVAAENISIIALFENKAVVMIDGNRHVLSRGQKSPEGVTLISADSNGATLEVDGKRQHYTLSDHIGTHFKRDKHPSVTIWPDNGMYRTTGSINGMPVDFLVDTGASTVAMNAGMARRLGIDYRLNGTQITVQTASGMARAYQITLDKVKVGAIEVHNVSAAVVDGPQPQTTLLGATFLNKVKMQRDGEAMTLTQKW